MHDLIFVSMEDWDDVWRRNQFLTAGLARRYPDCKILFVGLARDYTHGIRTLNFQPFAQPATWKPPEFANITITHPPKWFPNTFAVGRMLNEALFRRHVKKAAVALDIEQPLLWLNPHSAGHLVGKVGESAVIYDITDDWTNLTQSPWLTDLIREQDKNLCRAADAVIVCSERLRQLKEPLTNSLYLIPNGVDAAHYLKVDDKGRELPPETAAWRHPVLGYTGTVHSDRVDLPLVEALARRLPDATVALVGPVHLDGAERRRLEALGNVFFTGPKPYADLPSYMRAFDVCITPHLVTPFTESLNPIKLWEYLAVGKPIISTRVTGFRDYQEFVYLADNAEGFAAALQEALEEKQDRAERRRQEAGQHSWTTRLDAVEAVIARTLTADGSPAPGVQFTYVPDAD